MTDQLDSSGTFLQKTTLDNGLRVVTGTMPQTRSVSVTAFVGVGSRYEPAELAGISHFVEHLAFKGTKRRPTPVEISGAVEGVGGVMNAATEQELTVYWCKIARPYLDQSLDLIIDMLRNSVCGPDEIERERGVLLEEQGMVNDDPDYKVDALLDEILWPAHPLGRDVSGTRESVSSVTREMILDHIARFYTPSNTVISVAGDIDHGQVAGQVESLCDGWTSRTAPGWTPFTDGQVAPQLRTEYRKIEQAHLSIGLPGLSTGHPERYALDLLSVVLGEGMSSRLFLELREKRGLAYDVHSVAAHFQDCGAFVVSAGVDPGRVYKAVDTILAEVGRVREGVPAEELEKAKRQSTGRLLLSLEDTRAVSSWIGSQELLTGQVLDVDEVIERVDKVTPEDIRKVANDLLVTNKLNMAVVGPTRAEVRLRRSLVL
jgi:predicted Zn-dependent peptidase